MEFTPLPGPFFLELGPGQFINLGDVLQFDVHEAEVIVTYRNEQLLSWWKTYPISAATRGRLLQFLREPSLPHVLMTGHPR